MSTITAGTNFPTILVSTMFNAVQGRSALAKLSAAKPIAFAGETVMVFTADDEASIVGEGAAKPANAPEVAPKTIRPVKFVYQTRVSDEFLRASEADQLNTLETFADGFAKKIARGLDIAALHGIDPKTKAAASFKATNSFDGLVTSNVVAYDAAAIDNNIDAAVQAVIAGGKAVNGLALSPAAGAALGKIKSNGVAQYPEFRFGANPAAFYGMGSDVNSTVAVQEAEGKTTDHVVVGDFANAFRWGYAANIPLEVIEYGDPDGAGRDLKQYNEICLRSEAYIGWGILDADSFALVQA